MKKTYSITVFAVALMLVLVSMASAQTHVIFPRVSQVNAEIVPWLSWVQANKLDYQNLAVFQMGIALTNAGTSTSDVTLIAYGQDGIALSETSITNPASIQILAGHQTAKYVSQIFGSGIQQKIAWVEAVCNGGNVKGFYFIFDDSFNFLSGAAAIDPSKADTKIFLPLLDRRPASSGGEFRTELDIINPGTTPAKVTVHMWVQHGTSAYFTPDPMIGLTWEKIVWTKKIAPHGKAQVDWAWEITHANNSNWSGEPDGNNYFQIESDIPILASELVLRNSGVYTSSQTYSVTAVTGMSLKEGFWGDNGVGKFAHRPHVTLGSGWYTRVCFINGGAQYMVWDQNGNSLFGDPNYGTSEWLPGGTGTDAKRSTDLTSMLPKPVANLNGSLSFLIYGLAGLNRSMLDWTEFGPTNPDGSASDAFRAYVPPTPTVTSAVYPHVAEGSFGPGQSFGTGLAIKDIRPGYWLQRDLNIITVELYSADGRLLQTARVELGPAQKISKTIPELFPQMAIPQFGGYMKASGTQPFVSFGLYWVEKNGKLVAVSMIPQL